MNLDDLRLRIDAIDDEILALLERRADVVAGVARAKAEAGLAAYDPARERAVLERLAQRGAGRFPRESIVAVYREVMSACLSLQAPVAVAFLGPEGTFTHIAAREIFGLAARYAEAATIEGVFDAVRRSAVAYGVVPIENSTEGSVTHAADALLEGGLFIRRELVLEVSHCLLSNAERLTAVERVYSHPQALAQCRAWLAKNLSSAQLVQTSSTAGAAREASADAAGAAVGFAPGRRAHRPAHPPRAHPGSHRERHPLRRPLPRGRGAHRRGQDHAGLRAPRRTRRAPPSAGDLRRRRRQPLAHRVPAQPAGGVGVRLPRRRRGPPRRRGRPARRARARRALRVGDVAGELSADRRGPGEDTMITALYQGAPGAYSDVLLRRHFGARGEEVETLGLPTFRDVAVALLAGRARYGVLPLENTVAGTFREGYDLVAQYDLTPVREVIFRMDHRLLGVPGATVAGLTRIEAHPMVLEECGKFLATLPARARCRRSTPASPRATWPRPGIRASRPSPRPRRPRATA